MALELVILVILEFPFLGEGLETCFRPFISRLETMLSFVSDMFRWVLKQNFLKVLLHKAKKFTCQTLKKIYPLVSEAIKGVY